MKPERIQSEAIAGAEKKAFISKPETGTYLVLNFETFDSARNFSAYAEDMSRNHVLDVTCSIESNNWLSLRFPGNEPQIPAVVGKLSSAHAFLAPSEASVPDIA